MRLINANGVVALNIGLNVRQAPDQDPAYDYKLDISPSQASELTCDSGKDGSYQYPCHLSLFISIPSFEKTTTLRKKELEWMVS